jgi:HlyD family secretion protein
VQAQLDQARASYQGALASVQSAENGVTAADANVLSSQANVNRLTIALNQAKQDLDLTQSMIAQGVSAKNDLIAVQSTYDQAVVQVEQAKAQLDQVKAQSQSSRAQVAQAKAQLQQSQAQVETATVNLSRTTISAPIDGVVVARNVNVGQTVAASLQAPTLFLLAQDLTKMQVLANIDEADVGQLRTGGKVSFTVDAYPDSKFNGKISQIRLAPLVTQNVVTYTAVVDVANPDLKLYPGMTANITATTAERNDVLAVPNAALRFQPANAAALGAAGNSATGTKRVAAAGANPNAGAAGRRAGRAALTEGQSMGTVYKAVGEELVPVRLVLGLTDGVNTEVVKGTLAEGDQFVVAAASAAKATSAASTSPFAPQRPTRMRGTR